MGKSSVNGQFSIAMLNNQRVTTKVRPFLSFSGTQKNNNYRNSFLFLKVGGQYTNLNSRK